MIPKMKKTKAVNKKKSELKEKKVENAKTTSEMEVDQDNASDSVNCDGGPQQTVYISNLPLATTRQDLVELLASYGKIMFIHIYSGEEKKEAYIVFENIKSANKALKLHGINFKDSEIIVRKPEDRLLNFSKTCGLMAKFERGTEVKEEDLRQTFAKSGNVKTVTIFRHHQNLTTSGRAYIEFANEESVESALKIECTKIDKIPIKCAPIKEEQKIESMKTAKQSKTKPNRVALSENSVFVKNIVVVATTRSQLTELFSTCGDLEFIKMLRGGFANNGKAIVCFKSPDAVKSALKLDGNELNNQAINVEKFGNDVIKKRPIKKTAPEHKKNVTKKAVKA